MAKRNKGIIAYGTDEDRAKAAFLAELISMSVSELVIHLIREKYNLVMNDAS